MNRQPVDFAKRLGAWLGGKDRDPGQLAALEADIHQARQDGNKDERLGSLLARVEKERQNIQATLKPAESDIMEADCLEPDSEDPLVRATALVGSGIEACIEQDPAGLFRAAGDIYREQLAKIIAEGEMEPPQLFLDQGQKTNIFALSDRERAAAEKEEDMLGKTTLRGKNFSLRALAWQEMKGSLEGPLNLAAPAATAGFIWFLTYGFDLGNRLAKAVTGEACKSLIRQITQTLRLLNALDPCLPPGLKEDEHRDMGVFGIDPFSPSFRPKFDMAGMVPRPVKGGIIPPPPLPPNPATPVVGGTPLPSPKGSFGGILGARQVHLGRADPNGKPKP
ncbi:MAG: hypothetical protein M3O22_02865 [Pseudomonadota bacterium]|nr:hypothetical protein [Pseudomonadota bacterium]